MRPEIVRPTALVLNICVSLIATAQFTRAGHLRLDVLLPLAAASVPAAFVGGAIGLHPAAFEALLGLVLAAAAVRLGVRAAAPRTITATPPGDAPRPMLLAALGGVIGLLSGLTGIGGGVFLSPALLAIKAASIREVAGVSAAFILVNSASGLLGGIVGGARVPATSLPIVVAAVVGGAAGAHLGANRLSTRSLEGLMAAVLAVAATRLLATLAWAG